MPFTDIYAVQNLSFTDAVEQYAVTGGVPKYLEFFEDDKTLIEQIKNAVLSKSGFLYEEPFFLLKSESMTAVNYFSYYKSNCGWKSQTRKNSQCIGAGNFRTDTVSANTF